MRRAAGLDRSQQLRHPAAVLRRRHGDVRGQRLSPVPQRLEREVSQVAFPRQEIVVIDQPGAGPRHQLGQVERGDRLTVEVADQAPLGVLGCVAAAERVNGRRLMVE